MAANFLNVYQGMFPGKRVLFVYRFNSKRLPDLPPLFLVAEVVYDNQTGEYHSYIFDRSYLYEIKKNIYRFLSCAVSETEYRKLCTSSWNEFVKVILASRPVVTDEDFLNNFEVQKLI